VIIFLPHYPEDHPEHPFLLGLVILFTFAVVDKGGEGSESEEKYGGQATTDRDAVGVSGAAGFVFTSPANFLPIPAQNCSRHPNPRGDLNPLTFSMSFLIYHLPDRKAECTKQIPPFNPPFLCACYCSATHIIDAVFAHIGKEQQ
jgi:hypothetical protein